MPCCCWPTKPLLLLLLQARNNDSRPHHLLLLLWRWPEALHRPLVLCLRDQHRCCCCWTRLLLLLHVWPLQQCPTWPSCCHQDCPWPWTRPRALLLLWARCWALLHRHEGHTSSSRARSPVLPRVPWCSNHGSWTSRARPEWEALLLGRAACRSVVCVQCVYVCAGCKVCVCVFRVWASTGGEAARAAAGFEGVQKGQGSTAGARDDTLQFHVCTCVEPPWDLVPCISCPFLSNKPFHTDPDVPLTAQTS